MTKKKWIILICVIIITITIIFIGLLSIKKHGCSSDYQKCLEGQRRGNDIICSYKCELGFRSLFKID